MIDPAHHHPPTKRVPPGRLYREHVWNRRECDAPVGARWHRRIPVLASFVTLLAIGLLGLGAGGHAIGALSPPPQTEIPQPHLGEANKGDANKVVWVWSGALTPESIRVTARIEQPSSRVRLLLSQHDDLSSPLFSETLASSDDPTYPVVSFVMDALEPASRYVYAVEVDGVLDADMLGRFLTPREGAFSFTFAFGNCAYTGSNSKIFDTILSHDPLFLLHTGDMHYENIAVDRTGLFHRAFDRVLTSKSQSRLYRGAPIAYVWDDHDYGPNNSDKKSGARKAARLAYQESVPHYPLAAGAGDVPIYQAFTIGRARFIMTDSRSERTPKGTPDGPQKSMLGNKQKTWLKQELTKARREYPVVVWVNTVPWIHRRSERSDTWGGYHTERAEIADFIDAKNFSGLMMLSGDAHMLAIDDGTYNRYGHLSSRGFPVMHAGAFDQDGSKKGGPYTLGSIPGGGHFGLVTIDDDGGPSIRVRWSGRDLRDQELLSYEFRLPAEGFPAALTGSSEP